MSLFGWFQKGGAQVDKITDAVINSGDALFYTEEEKAEAAQERQRLYFKFLELSRDENSIKSITRRIIAFAVIGQWLLFLNICVGLYLAGAFTDGDKSQYFGAAGFVFDIIKDMFWFVFAVGSFYFGAGIINNMAKNKPSNK